MPRLHRIAAFCVLAAATAWVATGEFSSVGSAGGETVEASSGAAPGAAPASAADPSPAPVLRTVAAMEPVFVDHARRIRLSGITAADKRAVLAARTDGIIHSLALVKGGTVARDALVMTLEGPETLAQAEIAAIALAQRDGELARAEQLYSGGNAPEIEVTNARSARDAARAELARARAAVDRLELRAPFAGVVDTLEVEVGEWVQGGAPVATVLALDPIVVAAEVSELDLGSLAVGATAVVRLANGETREGSIRLIAREATAETRTFPVEILLANPGLALPSGMTAEVELAAAPVRAVVVPRSVVTLSDGGALGVRVVGSDNVAGFAPVKILDDTAEGLVVTGVPADRRIITAGQDLVRDGETVEVASAAALTAPAP